MNPLDTIGSPAADQPDRDIERREGSGHRPDGHGSDGSQDDSGDQNSSLSSPRGTDEFPPGAPTWLPELSRRRFIELMGASLALGGLGACNRPPEKEVVPNVGAADRGLSGRPLFYATAMPIEGYGRGILVESHEGRPTKIEGNPDHPESLGATDAITQAAILSLYDPDRSRVPRHRGVPAAWASFEAEWLERRRELTAKRGAGVAFITEPTTSPTLLRQAHRMLDAFPEARWFQHTAVSRYDDNGAQEDYDISRADAVLAIDADFLFQHPAGLRYSRAFASRRRVANGKIDANRLFVIEPTPTVTGTMADHRLPAAPYRIPIVLNAIAAAFGATPAEEALNADERVFVQHVVADLKSRAPNVLCVAGPQVGTDVRRWAAALNGKLGAQGKTFRRRPALRSDADPRSAGDLVALTKALRAGEVEALFILGANPVYTAPVDLAFAAALEHATWRVHLGPEVDETAVRCDWHLPESHFLESWGDIRGYDGTATILQPLIAPLYASRTAIELLSFLAGPPGSDGYGLVRQTWGDGRESDGRGQERQSGTTAATSGNSQDFETRWARWLNRGVVDEEQNRAARPVESAPGELSMLRVEPPRDVLLLRPDPTIGDGRWANNAWLQELPKPVTQLVWGNAALVSATFAGAHGWEENDLVRIRTAVGETSAPIWILPGQADGCVTLHLGYGRTHAGTVGNGQGADAYRVRSAARPMQAEIVAIEKIGRGDLVSTQHHFRMEGRDLARVCLAAQLPRASQTVPQDSLYPEWRYAEYRWGMTIDLATCIGCSACVVACQAENNIPTVGKEQVARGREMHWLRVDRYIVGDLANPRIVHQPVPCMQCEHAPCELVCPVSATVHSSEGLNDMVYNRCIGTRYCSNNCPYKVRRFNFFDFRAAANSPLALQKNPSVTVRERGVMEKCTYCVQRIDAARIAAEKANRRVRDGEVRTACQQVCPVEAIVFGDLADPQSAVVQRKREPTHYTLLEELNTRPRTTYLAKVVNPAADAEAGSSRVGRGVPAEPPDSNRKA